MKINFGKISSFIILILLLIGSAVYLAFAEEISESWDKMVNWKTYKNEQYGFQFSYPKSRTFFEKSSSSAYIWEGNYAFEAWPYGTRTLHIYAFTTPEELSNKTNPALVYITHYTDFPFSTTTINNQTAALVKVPEGYCDGPGCGPPFMYYAFPREKFVYFFRLSGDVILDETESEILKSFKLL